MTTSSPLRRAGAAGLAGASLLAMASAAQAGGFGASEISVEGMGRANSGEVADSGAGAMWWNPAAIARSGRELSLSVHHRQASTEFTDTGSVMTLPVPPAGVTVPVTGRREVEDASQDFTSPYAAIALPIGERVAVGLSFSRPFQLQTEFGTDAWTRYDTIRNKIAGSEVQGAIAVRASDWLDLGASVNAQRVEAYLDSAYPNLAPGASDALSHLDAEDWRYGWTVGAQAHLSDITFGASYRSAVEHEMDGTIQVSGLVAPLDTANFSAPSVTSFTLPWALTLGARWDATENLTFNLQVVRHGWSKYDAIHVDFAGQSAVIPQEFKDTTSLALGADYVLDEIWTVRAGLAFDPTPTPNDIREPGVFDADRRVFAVGATAAVSAGVRLHGALAFTDFSTSGINDLNVFYAGTPAMTTVLERGEFDGRHLNLAIGLDWSF